MVLLSSSNSYGLIFPNVLDISVYQNTEWCTNFPEFDFCRGRMYPTGKMDHNNLHPGLVFYELKCEVCGCRRWSEPKKEWGGVG